MKDVRGLELRLGDVVAATASRGHASMYVGEVIGFTPKKVRVSYYGSYENKDSRQIAILERNPVREAELENPSSEPEQI